MRETQAEFSSRAIGGKLAGRMATRFEWRQRGGALAIASALLACDGRSATTRAPGDAGVGAPDAPRQADGDAGDSPVVATREGPVRGATRDGIRIFYDVPYAAPPVGALRFRPPAPAPTRSAVRDATTPGLACPQPFDPLTASTPDQGEDCLALDVFSPSVDPSARAPVIVFVHGGSFVNGAGNVPLYDGTAIAKRGVVVVTINYRLGALGFLAHPALSAESPERVSGNYGLRDQEAALRWVQANVATFGGDPANVTLMGESAGAISVGLHVVSPRTRGLFHRAIQESGTCQLVTTPLHDPATPSIEDSAEERGERLARDVGCDGDDVLGCLRAKSPSELIARTSGGTVGTHEIGMAPNVDGVVIPVDPRRALLDGPANEVPLLLGTNADEGTVFSLTTPIHTVADYQAKVMALEPVRGAQLLAIWPASAFASPKAAYDALLGEVLFVCPTRETARAASRRAPTHLYHFEHVSHYAQEGNYGAYHAAELWYVFGIADWPLREFTASELRLSDDAIGYWTRFARSGDPNGDGAVPWPAYDPVGDAHLVLDETIAAGSALARARCDALEQLGP